MKILSVDTSTPRLSVALWEKGNVLSLSERIPEKRHAEAILPDMEKVLKDLNLSPKDLGGLAVGLGPGSFTGLRVGIATVQGMAQALQLPVAGVSSFWAAAAGTGADRVLLLEDARQEMYYAALYERLPSGYSPRVEERLMSWDALLESLPSGACALAGSAAEELLPRLSQAKPETVFDLVPASRRLPSAVDVAALAFPSLIAGGTAPEALLPLYLRRTQAEEMKARQQAARTQGGDLA
jgi:tRNA threonylcarbamoyladenosine biosynthesis protein TsaB